MALSYEKRHPPLPPLWIHERESGGGTASPGIESFLLLEDDPGDASSKLLLESDSGAGTDALLLEDST